MAYTTEEMANDFAEIVGWGDGIPSTNTSPTIVQLLDWFREGEMEAMDIVPEFSRATADITTTSGTAAYDDITDLWDRQIHHVTLTSSTTSKRILCQRDYDYMRRCYVNFESSSHMGVPREFCIKPRTGEIVFYPTPASTYTVTVEYEAVPDWYALPSNFTYFLAERPLDGDIVRNFNKNEFLDRQRNLGIVASYTDSGDWDATTNTPTLADSDDAEGTYYTVQVSGSGTVNDASLFGGVSTDCEQYDLVYHNGTQWTLIEDGAEVLVKGYTEEDTLTGPFTTILDGSTPTYTTTNWREIEYIQLPDVPGETIYVGRGPTIQDTDNTDRSFVTNSQLPDQWAPLIGPYYAAMKYAETKEDMESFQNYMGMYQRNLARLSKRYRDLPQSEVYFFGHSRRGRVTL